MTQTRNRQTTCDLCGGVFSNSGFHQHRKKCERTTQEKQEKEKQEKEPEQKETQKKEETIKEEPIQNDTIHIIEDTGKGDKNGFEKFFAAAGDFLQQNQELIIAVGATIASAKAEQQQQQTPKQISPYGDDW